MASKGSGLGLMSTTTCWQCGSPVGACGGSGCGGDVRAVLPSGPPAAAVTAPSATSPAPVGLVTTAPSAPAHSPPLTIPHATAIKLLSHDTVMGARRLRRIAMGEQELEGAAVCKKCKNLLVEAVTAHTERLKQARQLVAAAVHHYETCPAEIDENTEEESERIEQEREALLAELECLGRQVEDARGEYEALCKEREELEELEDHRARVLRAAELTSPFYASEEAASREAFVSQCEKHVAACSDVQGLNVFFSLETRQVPCTVNGCRLAVPDSLIAPIPASQTRAPWQEVNTALGHLALLAHTLKKMVGTAPHYPCSFILQGSSSKVVTTQDDGSTTTLNLFSADGCSTTSVDDAMACLCRVSRRVAQACGAVLPKQVKTANLALAEGHNDEWAGHIRNLVRNFQHLIDHNM